MAEADLCEMEFPIVNFISTAVSVAIAIWFAGVDESEINPCQEITDGNLYGTVQRAIEELRKGNTTNTNYIWRKIECSENISSNLKAESVAQIINESYSTNVDFFEILSFTHELVHQSQFKIRAYKELYNQINISNHIYTTPQVFPLANSLHTEIFFKELSSMFPKEVWMLILSKDVALRNAESGGPLFVGGRGVFYNQEKGQRNVLVWKSGNLGPQARWKFVLNNDGETFTVVNSYWNLCLYEDEWAQRFDDERGNVYASPCEDDQEIANNKKWKVTLTTGKDGSPYLKIKSAISNSDSSLLYSESSNEMDVDSYRSRVFVSRSANSEDIENKSIWRVSIFK